MTASSTMDQLVARVRKRTGQLPSEFLIRDWIDVAYADVMRRIMWTARRKQGQFTFVAPYTTGIATIVRGETLATFSGGAVITIDMVGQQLRVGGLVNRIATIVQFIDSTHVIIDRPWADASVATTFQIYQAYVTVPDDFDSFITVVDLTRNFQLNHWGHTQTEIDAIDPQRAYAGSQAYWIVLKDYTSDLQGIVGAATQAHGSGSIPVSGGTYTGPANALFLVEMTSASVFKWRKGAAGAVTTGVAIDPAGDPQDLQDGVQIAFPTSGVYVNGDVFVISAIAAVSPGLARYEPWPHIQVAEGRPYLYNAQLPRLSDDGAVLPRTISPDAIVELALAQWAAWPGDEPGKPNPAYSPRLALANLHQARGEAMIGDLEREDANRETVDLTYDSWGSLPVYDSGYLAGHDAGYELNVLY